MRATNVKRRVTMQKIVEAKMFVLKAKRPQEDKLLKMPKEGMVKVKHKDKLEEDKLRRIITFMLCMVAKSMRMCPML